MTAIALARPLDVPAARVAAARPPWWWRQRSLAAAAGLLLTLLGSVVAVLAASLIGPFIMFVAPLILVFGCAFGPLHAMLKGEL